MAFDFGCPGATHEASVLRTSAFYQTILRGDFFKNMWTFSIKLANMMIPPFILGDGAYPLLVRIYRTSGKGFDFFGCRSISLS